MDDPPPARLLQRESRVADHRDGLPEREFRPENGDTGDQLPGDIRSRAVFPRLMDGWQVGMDERSHDAHLGEESRGGVRGVLGKQGDRDLARLSRFVGPVDRSRAAPLDLLQKGVFPHEERGVAARAGEQRLGGRAAAGANPAFSGGI